MQQHFQHKNFTLITGASHGIGRAMAFECANHGMNLFLIALPGPELSAVFNDIKGRFNVKVYSLGIDLTLEESPKTIFEFSRENNIRINILINNAGFGIGGLFENSPLMLDYKMIKLNNMAMIGLIHYFLQDLKSFKPSHILNISSMEATLPLPYKTVYTGTKNFIYSFSLALNEELRHDNIRVSVVCPGPVITTEEGLKRFQAQGPKAKIIVKTPDQVARIAIHGMIKGKTIIIPGIMPWIIMKIINLLPELWKMRILERMFRVYKDMPVTKTY